MANEEMRDGWDGERGLEWVRLQERYDAMLAPWAELLGELAGVGPGERVLDVGCGCGATALDAARRTGPEGAVLGVDLSGPMVARARERAAGAGLGHARFAVADAQVDDVGAGHDVVTSRFGVMFFEDPVRAFANLVGAARPGGRLAVLAWAAGGEQQWLTVPGGAALAHVPFPDLGEPGAPGMFGLADPDRTAAILEEAGWSAICVEHHSRPMLLGGAGTPDDALAFVAATGPGQTLLAGAPDQATRDRALDAMRAALGEHLGPDGVTLAGTAWAITAGSTGTPGTTVDVGAGRPSRPPAGD